jgi:catechol 2,3-dioxygenase-like lactoylglutathione lyase family enzyme
MANAPMAARRADTLGVHSIDHFAIEVPDLAEARRFYELFGLDVRDENGGLALYTVGHPHRWGLVTQAAGPKRLRYLSFGAFEDEIDALAKRIDDLGVARIAPPAGADSNGIWFEGLDGLPVNIRVAEKSSPTEKSRYEHSSTGPGVSGAIPNSKAPKVKPRRLSHFALFVTDVDAAMDFYGKTLGVRLSDRSGPFVAFMHGPHGSDHHMLALLKSDRRGMHHVSWDVGSVQEVGLGMAQMARGGFDRGWGVGRHVLGANYFFYCRDPWGSYSEYSADMDYIPHDHEWETGDHPPEDSMFLWGPNPPEEFVQNFEPEREVSA